MKKVPPSAQTILEWRRAFIQTGNVQHRSRSEKHRANDEKINVVSENFTREPMTSTRSAEEKLQINRSKLQRILK